MDSLSNTFSVLELAEDDDASSASACSPATSKPESHSPRLNGMRRGKSKKDTVDDTAESSFDVCQMPLVWIDMEMTGLEVETDRILEIACIVTDGKLNKIIEGPDLVINQTKECLDRMGEWCTTHHGASGLTTKVLASTICEKDAENQVISFIKSHIGTFTPLLAGNSVYMDFIFLKKYMPDLYSLFHHNIVDVSSVKALCVRWFPNEYKKAPQKSNQHRAMADIRESINELKYYKECIFKRRAR